MDRLDWQKKAASISAGRELSGYDHPTEAIGPNPPRPRQTFGPPGLGPWPPSAR